MITSALRNRARPNRLPEDPLALGWWLWDTLDQAKQMDKDAFSGDHEQASGNEVLGHRPYLEAFRRRSRRLPVPLVIYNRPLAS